MRTRRNLGEKHGNRRMICPQSRITLPAKGIESGLAPAQRIPLVSMQKDLLSFDGRTDYKSLNGFDSKCTRTRELHHFIIQVILAAFL